MVAMKSLDAEEIVTERASRRDAMRMIGAAGAAVATAIALPASAQDDGAVALCSDSDPYDPAGYGRRCGGCSDSDPYDPVGGGRSCGGSYARCSDSDPYDPGGYGRHCGGRPSYGCSDSDPYDPGGRGRHC
jgi:hypothetical protein